MVSQTALSPRSARTRAALIAAGFELLVERPIDAIPIDDVVAKAGVAKGSFFNHFVDKQAFANAIATEVRLEVEALVTRANEGIEDPVERIAGGMRVAAKFALTQPKRTAVLLRSQGSSTARRHPLNSGLRVDIEAAVEKGLLRHEARESGLLYWLGLCQAVMTNIIEVKPSKEAFRNRLAEILILGLTGLGVPEARAAQIANDMAPEKLP
ncbi:TetR/AcrR family transcriptional regulator [Sphingorhabdus pulchriflava]|uniref:TetR/AcrR family transcriptional regulator n=1 Tax=Sphingorhabdus pulchriflava TaxID=2292257 RepID=A0A371B1Q7_9SPHN|nr:TetR/AcrR family transcriptional regulator [Sphingorhabdus pulchriflava]RDV01444.1 TetR/AcrR family transcriptional regulator [Sphingorhabdus pulchriflava]